MAFLLSRVVIVDLWGQRDDCMFVSNEVHSRRDQFASLESLGRMTRSGKHFARV
jgi:hypothetical protein